MSVKRVLGVACVLGVFVPGFGQAVGGAAAGTQTVGSAKTQATVFDPAKQVVELRRKLEDWPQLGRYRAENEALPAVGQGEARVVFYGDSITDAWGRRGGTFFPGKPYVNRGISGQTTPQMVVRFQQDVIALKPRVVVILAGTNDVAGNTGPMTPEMTEDNFRSMAELGKANGIAVVLSSILPVADYPWRPGLQPAGKIRALNAWMKSYCATSGCTYLDYYTPMADSAGGMREGLSLDGVHPNAKGYAVMEPLAEAAVKRALAGSGQGAAGAGTR